MSLSRRLANLGKAIDSATTGHFLSKGDSDGLFETIQYSDLTGRPTVLDSANITAIVDSAYIQLRQTSAGSGGLDSAAITTLVDSAYVSARSPAASSGFAAYEYNTSAAQTTFQDSDVNGNVLSYSANGIIVYYNGVLMPTSDYTATDGSSVVFTTAVDSGGTVTIAKWALASSGAASSSYAWGDRAVIAGDGTTIDYYDITTPSNATDFGDLSASRQHPGAVSDITYGVWAGTTTIDYVTIATPANATDFGDQTISRSAAGGVSNITYGIFGGGNSGSDGTIDYITIASPSNATDFGDLSLARQYVNATGYDDTYGLFAGGRTTGAVNTIDYITMASPSNASDFGDLTISGYFGNGGSSATITVFGGFNNGSNVGLNNIAYVTTATPANATDFGDLTVARYGAGCASNGTYATWAAGNGNKNTIDYVTIATPSNATDFGDLTVGREGTGGCSGSPS